MNRILISVAALLATLMIVQGWAAGTPAETAASFSAAGDGSDLVTNAPPRAPAVEPEADDEHFVQGSGPYLDRYLFRPDVPNGKLTFDIPITRYFFNESDSKVQFVDGFLTESAVNHLVSKNVLPATARLRLRVYDVDEDAQPCSEVDHIYVNGKQLLVNGLPAKLSGANNTWSPPSFDVPIGFLKFPQNKGINGNPPTPVDNEIAIDIDVLECSGPGQRHWAVQVDWGMIEIPDVIRPIVFAHGWTADTNTFNQMEGLLEADGIPSAGQADLLEGIRPIAQTGNELRDWIVEKGTEFGVNKVNILAHSKGGLVTRQALSLPGIPSITDHVVTFASPHHGTNMAADLFLKIKCNRDYSSDETRKNLCISSGRELTKDSMREFNYSGCEWKWFPPGWSGCEARPTAVRQGRVEYFSFAADGDEAVKPLRSTTYPWEADDVPFPDNINVDAIFNPSSAFNDHNAILDELIAYRCAIAKIDPDIYQAATVCPSSTPDAGQSIQSIDAGEVLQTVLIEDKQMLAPGAQDTAVTIDSTSLAVFRVTSSAAISLTLETPAAAIIDPAAAATNPDIIYVGALADLGWVYEYQISNPQAGGWQVQVSAPSAVDYSVSAQNMSAIGLNAATDRMTYQPGQQLTVEAALDDNGVLISAASISAYLVYPDGSTASFLLVDNGSNGDTTAGDKVYTGQAGVGADKGVLTLLISGAATGLTRAEQISVGVSPQTAVYKQVNSEAAVDTNSNGLYDELQINLTMTVLTAGHFEVEALLKNGSGQVIGSGVYSSLAISSTELAPGDHVIPFLFDGETIHSYGQNGPYTLTNVFIKDTTSGTFEVDTESNVHTTAAYLVSQFERPLLLTSNFDDTAVDTNSNGRFDILQISFLVDVVQPGSYDVNGRLVDPAGGEIEWSQSSFNASTSGIYPVQLDFSGLAIGTHGVNGPYTLRDLTLFSTSGQANLILDRPHTTGPYANVAFEGGIARLYLPIISR